MRPRSAYQLKTLFSLSILLVQLSVSHVAVAQESGNTGIEANSSTGTDTEDATAPATNTERQKKIIVVKEGETLLSISRSEFGTRSLWRHIAEFNQIDVDVSLLPGQILLLPTLINAPRQYALVVYTHGQADRIENDTASPVALARNDRIFPGTIIETGQNGFASISFQNGSVVNLQPESRFKLRHLDCLDTDKTCFVDVSVPTGDVTIEVESIDNQSSQFRITTPFASAAVRGTRFDFIASGSQLLLGVTEGAVAVQSAGAEVVVDFGFGAKTLANQPPGDPVPLLHLPTFTNIPPRLAVTDRIGWWRVTDAANYEWTISSDAASSNVIEKQTTPGQFVEIGDLAAGDYYLQVRALNDDGLKGFPNTEKFSVADIVDIGSPPIELAYTRTGRELLIEVLQPDPDIGAYEIQIASTAEFIDVVSIDVGPSGQAFFSDMNREMYLRARALISPREVSAFGPSLQTD
ncbi:MAG: FecR domain-containing protein [Granulosicoccus sp.]|nr:FecR domain-containing protein [Granulosicoccus sp.]